MENNTAPIMQGIAKENQFNIQYKSDKDNNWFSRIKASKGETYFLVGLTVDEVNRNAERIINDMIYGNINYNIYGQYVVMPIVLDTLLSYCTNKLSILSGEQAALGYFYNDYKNGYIQVVKSPVMAYSMQQYTDNMPVTGDHKMPIVIDESMLNSITQSIAMHNQDMCIYRILYDSLYSVNMSKAAHELYQLKQRLQPYMNFQSKRF